MIRRIAATALTAAMSATGVALPAGRHVVFVGWWK